MAARPIQPKILADKGIRPEIEPEKKKQKEQYKDVLANKNKSAEASDLSPQMARVIRWNVPDLYQQKKHRLLKKITEHADILTKNKYGKTLIYGNAIFGSNLKMRFKSMGSNKQNINQIGIDEFFRVFRRLGVNIGDIISELLKLKYSNVAPYSTHKRHSTNKV